MKDVVMQEFRKYLEETFGEQYDPQDVQHLTYLGIFESGWDARGEYETE